MHKGKMIAAFIVLALLLTVGAGVSQAAEKDYVIAKMGNQEIRFSEIQAAAANLNRFLKENFETSLNWRMNYIRQYVAQKALAKRASREGLEKDKDVMAMVDKAKEGIIADKLLGDALAKNKATEEDMRRYYRMNKTKYQIKEKVKISYVKPKNKAHADKLIANLDKGKDFRRVAGRQIVKVDQWVSMDAPPMVEGLEAAFTQDTMNKLFTLNVGQNTGIIEAKEEFYIFHVDEKEPAKDRPYEEVARQVGFDYNRELRNQTIGLFVQETFRQEGVEVYEDVITANMPPKE